jgi:DNA primase
MTTMTDIDGVLQSLGVEVTHSGPREISGRCPVHERVTGHADRRPSWSMNRLTGAWICYSCGARGSLMHLVQELTGDADAITVVQDMLIQSGMERLLGEKKPQERERPQFDEWVYERFPEAKSSYLARRDIDPEDAWVFGVRRNPENRTLVLPIRHEDGTLLGWQEKNADSVRNYPNEVPKSTTLFGLDVFLTSGFDQAILVESPLDVVRLYTLGIGGGLASYGVEVSDAQIHLLAKYADELIVALDNDTAGVRVAKALPKRLPHFRKGVKYWAYKGKAKDPGDQSRSDCLWSYRNARVIGWWL